MSKNDERLLWPLPETDGPFEYTPVCIPIPNDPQHRQNFLGALLALSRWFNYTRTNDNRGKIAADAWLYTFDQAVTAVSAANPCCGGTLYKSVDGVLYQSDDDGLTWYEVDDGGNGPWDDYDITTDGDIFKPPTGIDDCQAAWNAARVYQAFHIELAPYFVVGGLVALAITGVATGFAFFLGGGPLAFAAVGSVVTAALALVSGGLVADDFSEEITEQLVCIFKTHMTPSGSIDEAGYNAALDDISAETGLIWDAIWLYVSGMGIVGLQNAAYTQSEAEPDCTVCDWVEYFLGEYGQRTLEILPWTSTNFCEATYESGVLVGCCGGNSTGQRVRAHINFAEANITRVKMYTETNADATTSDGMFIYNGLVEIVGDGTATGIDNKVLDSGPIDIMSGELVFRVSAAMGASSCAGTTRYARVTLIEIRGRGFNPFA